MTRHHPWSRALSVTFALLIVTALSGCSGRSAGDLAACDGLDAVIASLNPDSSTPVALTELADDLGDRKRQANDARLVATFGVAETALREAAVKTGGGDAISSAELVSISEKLEAAQASC